MRVTDTYNRVQTKLHNAEILAKEAADKARKATAYAALWLFISLLIGAFVASLSATYGGRQRDL
jgi:cation transporter-like permease